MSSLYRHAVERAFDRRLDVYLRTLVADVASPEEGNDKFPQSIGEPLFELPLSGWYWQVTRLDTPKPELHSSRSLWDSNLPRLRNAEDAASASGGYLKGYAQGPEEVRLRLVERNIDLGDDGRYLIAVAGDASEIDDEMRSFDRTIGGIFAALAVALLLTTALQVRFGLSPLKRISESLAAIRSGRAERLEGEFPVEIASLARETNALIEANREIVERARTHVGNLAHALKTPLSVIVNEAAARANDPLAQKVLEQAEIMRDQVARQLERARLAARSTVVGTLIDVPPVVTALARTMEKLHRERDIAIAIDVPEHARFRGEQQDLEEMIGNLSTTPASGRSRGWRSKSWRTSVRATAKREGARHRRRRRAGTFARRARAGGAARATARREQARLGPRPLHRRRARRSLWRRADAWYRADRRLARGTRTARRIEFSAPAG